MRAFPLTGLSTAMVGAGRYGEALEHAEEALALAPTELFSLRGDAHAAAAEALWTTAKRAQAKSHAEAAKQDYADAGPVAADEAEEFETRWSSR